MTRWRLTWLDEDAFKRFFFTSTLVTRGEFKWHCLPTGIWRSSHYDADVFINLPVLSDTSRCHQLSWNHFTRGELRSTFIFNDSLIQMHCNPESKQIIIILSDENHRIHPIYGNWVIVDVCLLRFRLHFVRDRLREKRLSSWQPSTIWPHFREFFKCFECSLSTTRGNSVRFYFLSFSLSHCNWWNALHIFTWRVKRRSLEDGR